ncbi:cell division protein FtsL [Allofrancisella guangzhouensis]|uniref:Cell division protein FtsL n=1 Tax=Allofrancisella guangzhouensis TaxID=594679 RepID=A0A0A8E431_9GAMM|nr:cell division protein FtsL [Allofrancisella guangzhouensis]AJC48758.1 cell division protein FtsL [Allofrancisella guangzhouensis]MBK2027355.1 cell division protein FtsL [Allofrancisella guangzhouensis]MBK2043460.1 cell division protein FtsL [Allofrancisella guangzhouensis]MBK2045229.1 cell division protein FtsL [Allofrancisella guangzhouensis]
MMLTNRQIRIKLFESLRNSFFKKTVIISFVLLFILLVTAFSLIVIRFEYKLQVNEQKELIVEKTRLDEQWSQIVLEYSSLATPTAVENFAQKEQMSLPTKNDIKFLNEGVDE